MQLRIRRVTLCHMNSDTGIPPGDRKFKEGHFFLAYGFWLQPDSESVIADVVWPKKVSETRLINTKTLNRIFRRRPGKLTRKKAEVMSRALGRAFKQVAAAHKAAYNAQPRWFLDSLTVNSTAEAKEVLKEFMDFVDHTTSYSPWATDFLFATGLSLEDLKKHGWKHITYDFIKELTDGERDVLVPKVAKVYLVGTSEQFLDLIRQAEKSVPQAVARLEFLFPERQDLADACEFYLMGKMPRERLDAIPTVSQLAGEWATEAVRNPDSKDAQVARDSLDKLVSKNSALRSGSNKGRPKLQVPSMAVKELYKMCLCLFVQVKQVRGFLVKHSVDNDNNMGILRELYPWLKNVSDGDILSFVENSASAGAMQITGHILGIGPTKVQQMIYSD